MTIDIVLTREAIPPIHESFTPQGREIGARVVFEGIVRSREGGAKIRALCYEAYEKMASREIASISEELGRKHSCQSILVIHRIGIIPVGELAVRVVAEASHRAEAFAMVAEFLDLLKDRVPIWKTGTIT
jgi:molybdopterin synthase catalytic subunit